MSAVKSFFASYHLTSAAHNARIAGEAEKAVKSEGRDGIYRGESLRRWQPIHDAHVMTSFIETFAGIEASINEILEDPVRFSSNTDSAHEVSPAAEINELETAYPGNIMRESTLQKYQLVLLYTGNSPFDRGAEPYQSVDTIRRLRNYFAHHEPERVEKKDENPETSLGKALQSEDFELNPFRPDEPYFPGRCLSYGCAKWVFESSIEFINEFYDRIEAKPPYSSHEDILFDEIEVGWEERNSNYS